MDQTELSAILPTVKSCNVEKLPVTDPSCSVHTAATECYPIIVMQCEKNSDLTSLKIVSCEL